MVRLGDVTYLHVALKYLASHEILSGSKKPLIRVSGRRAPPNYSRTFKKSFIKLLQVFMKISIFPRRRWNFTEA